MNMDMRALPPPNEHVPLCPVPHAPCPDAQLSSERDEAQEKAVGALYNLACNAENKTTIVRSGALPPLMLMLGGSESAEAQEAACGVIAELAREKGANRKVIVHGGGVPLLVELLGNEVSRPFANDLKRQKQKEAVKGAAGGKAKPSGNAPLGDELDLGLEGLEGVEPPTASLGQMDEEGGGGEGGAGQGKPAAPPGKEGVGKEDRASAAEKGTQLRSPNTQKYAACALWGLSSEETLRDEIVNAGAARGLVGLLRSSSEAKGYATAALCNLCKHPQVQATIKEQGGMEPLVELTKGTTCGQWLRQQAVGIIAALSAADKGRRGDKGGGSAGSVIKAAPLAPSKSGAGAPGAKAGLKSPRAASKAPVAKPSLRTDKVLVSGATKSAAASDRQAGGRPTTSHGGRSAQSDRTGARATKPSPRATAKPSPRATATATVLAISTQK